MIAAAIMLGTPGAALAVSAGVAPEDTEERKGSDTMWNLVGLIGLFGLIGYSRPSDNDGYTDDPI